LIDIVETVYRGASKGRGLVVSPKGLRYLTPDNMWYLTFRDRLLDTIQVLKYRCEMVEDIDIPGHAVGCIELFGRHYVLFSLSSKLY
jgi:hypothetical protein